MKLFLKVSISTLINVKLFEFYETELVSPTFAGNTDCTYAGGMQAVFLKYFSIHFLYDMMFS